MSIGSNIHNSFHYIFVVLLNSGIRPILIFNFCLNLDTIKSLFFLGGFIDLSMFYTKKHWKNNSKLEWIEEGLKNFVKNYKKWNITSVAFPQLGINHGKLNWNHIRPIMENYLNSLDISVEIYILNP